MATREFRGFRITGLPLDQFSHLFGSTDEQLALQGMQRITADTHQGYPDRIEMCEAAVGETLLLLNHTFQSANTPYRGSHAVYVREAAKQKYDRLNQVPDVMRRRLLSLRAYDASHMMIDADICDGQQIEALIELLFSNPSVAYIHVHYAKRGCYSGRVDRAEDRAGD